MDHKEFSRKGGSARSDKKTEACRQNASKPRFSRRIVTEKIYDKIYELEEMHNFDFNLGWEQVDGKGEEINRAFGEYTAMCDFLEKI
jgi:hypothetical protein